MQLLVVRGCGDRRRGGAALANLQVDLVAVVALGLGTWSRRGVHVEAGRTGLV